MEHLPAETLSISPEALEVAILQLTAVNKLPLWYTPTIPIKIKYTTGP